MDRHRLNPDQTFHFIVIKICWQKNQSESAGLGCWSGSGSEFTKMIHNTVENAGALYASVCVNTIINTYKHWETACMRAVCVPCDPVFRELLWDETAGECLDGLEGEVCGVHCHPVPHQAHLSHNEVIQIEREKMWFCEDKKLCSHKSRTRVILLSKSIGAF